MPRPGARLAVLVPPSRCPLGLHQLHDDTPERCERLVDVHRLLEVVPLGLGSSHAPTLDPLAACEESNKRMYINDER